MSLWYLMLTQQQADRLNEIFVPLYSPYPYVPVGLFPYVDGGQFAESIYDPNISEVDQDYILEIMQSRKTYEQAIAAGWIIPPNDG
jgi:hypothetical protein